MTENFPKILKADGGTLLMNEPVGRDLHLLEVRFLPSDAYAYVSGADGCYGVDVPGFEHQRCFSICLQPENLGSDGITAARSSWSINGHEQEQAASAVFNRGFRSGSKALQTALDKLDSVFDNILSAVEEAFSHPSVAQCYRTTKQWETRCVMQKMLQRPSTTF